MKLCVKVAVSIPMAAGISVRSSRKILAPRTVHYILESKVVDHGFHRSRHISLPNTFSRSATALGARTRAVSRGRGRNVGRCWRPHPLHHIHELIGARVQIFSGIHAITLVTAFAVMSYAAYACPPCCKEAKLQAVRCPPADSLTRDSQSRCHVLLPVVPQDI